MKHRNNIHHSVWKPKWRYHGNRSTKIMGWGDVRYWFAMAILVMAPKRSLWDILLLLMLLLLIIERGLYCNHLVCLSVRPSVCPSVHTFVTDISASTGRNVKWFYIWYMALAWWLVPCLPFPGLPHIYFLFTARLTIFHVCRNENFRNRYLSFYWKKWFYIWYMALVWWLVPGLPFPGLPYIHFLFTMRLRIFHVCCNENFRNRYLSFYWKKWFYIWYMALAWWLVPCLPFPGLPHIYFLFTARLRIFHFCCNENFCNRHLSFYWKKWFYIWCMALAWWLVQCLPFPDLLHIYFLFTMWL